MSLENQWGQIRIELLRSSGSDQKIILFRRKVNIVRSS